MACKRLRGKTKFAGRTPVLTLFVFSAFVFLGLLIGVQPALANFCLDDPATTCLTDVDCSTGQCAKTNDTVVAGCMEETSGRELRCTANDVQLANVSDLVILDDGCAYPGDMVTFAATFEVILTAQERHDIGIYFATDGDPNGNGALSGGCTIATVPYSPDQPFLDLDGTLDDPNGVRQDTCGDINDAHNPLYPVLTITTRCIDPDNNGMLNLPNCTSWRQPGANELCTKPTDAFPGAPSKCRCDIGFEVPIEVPPASITVTKTASPTAVDEPGGNVTFSVSVMNQGIDPNNHITLNSLKDNVYGDITQVQGDIQSTTCSVPQILVPTEPPYTCSFVAYAHNGDVVGEEMDTVTATGLDQRDPPNTITGSDDAIVTIKDLLPAIKVEKTVTPGEVKEPGGEVTFQVVVTNTSQADSDPVTITSLIDDVHGDLNGQGDCSVPQMISPGGSYTCTFTAIVSGNMGDEETDTVTAMGKDDEGNPANDADSAMVKVIDVPSMISLTKTPNPTDVYEPGGEVTFTLVVFNNSAVDSVTITSLTDKVEGVIMDLNGKGDCAVPQTIAAGDSYSCSFKVFVSDNEFHYETDTATASGTDDDGQPVSASANATVNITNVPPSGTLTKTAATADVTFEVVVTNTSTVEALDLTALHDDIYGDLTDIGDEGGDAIPQISTTCSVPQTILPGDSYSCSFVATVSSENTPETNTVTGTLIDDDSSSPINPSDTATVDLK